MSKGTLAIVLIGTVVVSVGIIWKILHDARTNSRIFFHKDTDEFNIFDK